MPCHNISRHAAKYDVFTRFISPYDTQGILNERAFQREGGLYLNKGNNNICTLDGTEGLAMRIIAVGLHIYAHQESHLTYWVAIKRPLRT